MMDLGDAPSKTNHLGQRIAITCLAGLAVLACFAFVAGILVLGASRPWLGALVLVGACTVGVMAAAWNLDAKTQPEPPQPTDGDPK
jgi:hypothetical protein